MRVVLIGIGNIRNHGDAILSDVTAWLIRRARPDVEVVRVELYQGGRGVDVMQRIRNRLARRFQWMADKTSGDFSFRCRDWQYRLTQGRRLRSALKGADAVVYALGMFKYATQDESYMIYQINRLAAEAHIPVLMSAMSVSEADGSDWRSRQLARALQLGEVYFTTRDGEAGVRRLLDGYGADRCVRILSVGDPALWIPECYGLPAANPMDTGVVGVNLIREDIFELYGGDVSSMQLRGFYGALIEEFDRRGWKWRLFSNGIRSDERFGRDLLRSLGRSESLMMPLTGSPADYCRMVASFRAIFAARLHAFISAAALNVPAVALAWDDKFRMVAQEMHREAFLLEAAHLNARLAADALELSMRTPYDHDRVHALRESTALALVEFIGRGFERDSDDEK